ncbi:hypothetical protein ACVW00_002763 [Marmoricola sp. URHA0025 HA25]
MTAGVGSRRAVGVLLLLLVVAGCGSSPVRSGPSGSGASCAGPWIDDQPADNRRDGPAPTVAAGDVIRIYGHWYTSTCNDTGSNAPLEPLDPVHLVATLPDGTIVDLGRFEPAGPDLGFSADLRVPAGTSPGPAKVVDDREEPAAFDFVIGKNAG